MEDVNVYYLFYPTDHRHKLAAVEIGLELICDSHCTKLLFSKCSSLLFLFIYYYNFFFSRTKVKCTCEWSVIVG